MGDSRKKPIRKRLSELERLEQRCLLSADSFLVSDINTTTDEPWPFRDPVAIDDTLFFVAHDEVAGLELWKSDGTEAGTEQVKDVRSGIANSAIHELTNVGGRLFFYAVGGGTSLPVARACPGGPCGRELWVSDGTDAGTLSLEDWLPSSGIAGYETTPVALNGALLFFSQTGIWRSDGTEQGTMQLSTVQTHFPRSTTIVGDTVYFHAMPETGGTELWKTDGTFEGTTRVSDLLPGSATGIPYPRLAVNDQLFFTVAVGVQQELWVTDDSQQGATRLGTGSFTWLTEANGTLFFVSGNTGDVELWKSDGTAEGTLRVKDLPKFGGLRPSHLTDVDGTLFFTADDTETGRELWTSDGTDAGTRLVKDIWTGGNSSSPYELTDVNGTLVFTATDKQGAMHVWTSDGTEHGTARVSTLLPAGPAKLDIDGDTLFVSVDTGQGENEIWTSDGTEAGTVHVHNIQVGTQGSFPDQLTEFRGGLVFTASDGFTGRELWTSDGTTEGTTLMKDILVDSDPYSSSHPWGMTEIKDTLFFAADDGVSGHELWKTDGTEAGTVLVKDIAPGSASSYPDQLTDVNGVLYFSASGALWKSDGSAAGTTRIAAVGNSPWHFTAVGDTLFFSAYSQSFSDHELWKSDGTKAGTGRVKDVFPGTPGSDPESLTPVGNVLFFTAMDSVAGRELWRSDGTETGTVRVKDVLPGPADSYPYWLTNVNGVLYFSAQDEEGSGLWKSDGTEAGTVLVTDTPDTRGLGPFDFWPVGDKLFFTAFDEQGAALWASDGTGAGTQRVADIQSSGGHPVEPTSAFAVVDGTLFFTARDQDGGEGLWKSDGTAAGTLRVAAVNVAGTMGDCLVERTSLTAVGDTIFFAGHDGLHGNELLAFSTGPLPGDANLDGDVGFPDFLILADNYGRQENVTFSDGDFDGDGAVSFVDFLILSSNFGRSQATAEPPVPLKSGISEAEATDAFFGQFDAEFVLFKHRE